MKDLPAGGLLDCRACGTTCIPSVRTKAHDGSWIDTQAPGLKYGGSCSFECMKSLALEDALRADGNISINIARSKWGQE